MGLPDLPHEGIVGVEHRHAAGGETLQHLGLGGRDRLHRIEELEVHRRDHRDDGHVRTRERGQRAQLAGGRHPQLQHGRGVLGGQPEERQRQAVPVVQVAFGLEHRAPRGEERRRHLLGGGLSRRARDGHDRDVGGGPYVVGQVGQGLGGVLHPDEAQSPRRGDLAVDDGGGGPGRGGGGEEVVAVEARAGDGEEHLARPDRPRIDGDAFQLTAVRAGQHLPSGHGGHVLQAQRAHGHGDRPHAFPPRSGGSGGDGEPPPPESERGSIPRERRMRSRAT